jgi:hypothetical protein
LVSAALILEVAASEMNESPSVFCATPEGDSVCLYVCQDSGINGLLPEVKDAVTAAVKEYYLATGEAPVITSGYRTLRHCAALMADFDQEQLEQLYCRHGYPSYIRDIVSARKAKGSALDAEEVYEILRQRQEGYISWHLAGGAVDFRLPQAYPDLLRDCLQRHGFSVLDETEAGVPCWHATKRGLTPQIIRE